MLHQLDCLDNMVRVEFRLWKQGRVNVESLTLKLKAAVRHALWDLVLEVKLLTAPFLQVQLSDRALSIGKNKNVPTWTQTIFYFITCICIYNYSNLNLC